MAALATLTPTDVAAFRGMLDDSGVVEEPGMLAAANLDFMRYYRGRSMLLLRPRSTGASVAPLLPRGGRRAGVRLRAADARGPAEDVSAVLRYCNGRRLGVVPQGCAAAARDACARGAAGARERASRAPAALACTRVCARCPRCGAHAHEARDHITPARSGNTGLVGGGVPMR